jgi:hypothetical protein
MADETAEQQVAAQEQQQSEDHPDIKQVEADEGAGDDEEEDEEKESKEKIVNDAKTKLLTISEGGSPYGSTLALLNDLNVELDNTQKELLRKVRKSVHIARGNAPNLRLNATVEEGINGMKTVDMSALLNIIGEEQVKLDVEKEAAKSKKMVENISKLLMSEGFL